jgi:hypothetical protein
LSCCLRVKNSSTFSCESDIFGGCIFIALPDQVWDRQCVPESAGSGSETLPSTRVNRIESNEKR